MGNLINSTMLIEPIDLAVDEEGSIWISDFYNIKKFGKTGNLISVFNPINTSETSYSGIDFLNGNMYVGACTQSKNVVIVLNANGEITKQINLQGNNSKGCGNPCGSSYSNNMVFVLMSDSEDISSQHIQVYNSSSGVYSYGFGGNQCNDVPPNYLCQPFNGIEFIPQNF